LLQRVSIARYAERCISYDRFCQSDRLTHAGIMPKRYQLSSSLSLTSFLTVNLAAKFQGEHEERGRRKRQG